MLQRQVTISSEKKFCQPLVIEGFIGIITAGMGTAHQLLPQQIVMPAAQDQGRTRVIETEIGIATTRRLHRERPARTAKRCVVNPMAFPFPSPPSSHQTTLSGKQ